MRVVGEGDGLFVHKAHVGALSELHGAHVQTDVRRMSLRTKTGCTEMYVHLCGVRHNSLWSLLFHHFSTLFDNICERRKLAAD